MNIKIIAKKHDNSFHRSWEKNTILKNTAKEIIGVNERTLVTNSDLSSFRTTNRALFYFSKEKWFNIIHIDDHLNPYYYCNLSSPHEVKDDVLTYVDYDIDVEVDKNFNYQVLDLNEFEMNKIHFNYSNQIDNLLKASMKDLIKTIEKRELIFSKEILSAYYNLYDQK